MKTLFTLIFSALVIIFHVSAQSYTSINDGSWTNPTTWSPTGVPVTFTDVTINHNVILNTDFGYYSGTITITNSGTLIQDQPARRFVINGGELLNEGVFTVDTFAIFSGDFTNGGTSNTSITYINGNVTNTGTWDNIDSLYNDNMLYNDGGDIYVDQFFNADYFETDMLMPMIFSMTAHMRILMRWI